MKKILALLFIIICFMPAVLASQGTLISGSFVDVGSNRADIAGTYVIGTWAVTPARADSLDFVQIDNTVMPDGYSVETPIRVDFQKTRFEQVFEVTEQRRTDLFVPAFSQQFFAYSPFTSDREGSCKEKVNQWLDSNNRVLFPGISYNAKIGFGSCTVQMILVDYNGGWFANVIDQETYYEQKIDFGSKGTITLQRTETNNNPTGKIPGVASATLVQFGNWDQARLTDKNIYAYQLTNSDSWKVFEDQQGISRYRDLVADLKIEMQQGYHEVFTTGVFSQLTDAVKDEVNRIRGIAGQKPTSWTDKAGTIRTAGNQIIAELTYNTYVTNVQLLLSAKSFGIFRPVGEPRIVELSTCNVVETEKDFMEFKVKNDATEEDAFTFQLVCDQGVIGTSFQQNVAGGQTLTSKIRIDGKSISTDDLTTNCQFKVSNSEGESVSKALTCTVEAKDSCVKGQETDPLLVDGVWYVSVLDDDCSVLSTKQCQQPNVFEKRNGFYECVESGNSGGVGGDGTSNVSVPLLIIAVISGIILSIVAFVYLPPTLSIKLRLIIVLIVFLIGFFGTAFIATWTWNLIKESFTF